MTVLVVGESLVDVVVAPDGSAVERPGGSPLNVAVGLSRLGLGVELLTALGDDAHGVLLQDHLAACQVLVHRHALPRTSVALAQLDTDGRATYSFDLEWDLGPAEVGRPGWVHVGSLGVTLEPGASAVAALVQGLDGAVVSYDPNCRPALMGSPGDVLERVEHQVRRSDLVKLSDEDAQWLFPGEALETVARSWLDLGPAVVVVTSGAAGAQARTRQHHAHVPVAPGGPVVDTVGAGDAFTAGLIWALAESDLRRLRRDELVLALETAAVVARRTCERVGADPPWRHEL